MLLTAGLNTLRNCLSKCGPSYGEKTPLGASIDHKDSSDRSHGHIVTAVLVRRVPSQASDQDSKVETCVPPPFCLGARCAPETRAPGPVMRNCQLHKKPHPPCPPTCPYTRARAQKGFKRFQLFRCVRRENTHLPLRGGRRKALDRSGSLRPLDFRYCCWCGVKINARNILGAY